MLIACQESPAFVVLYAPPPFVAANSVRSGKTRGRSPARPRRRLPARQSSRPDRRRARAAGPAPSRGGPAQLNIESAYRLDPPLTVTAPPTLVRRKKDARNHRSQRATSRGLNETSPRRRPTRAGFRSTYSWAVLALRRSFARKDRPEACDGNIETSRGAVRCILDIPLDHVIERHAAPTLDLPQACMPGLTESRRRCHFLYWATSYGIAGLGPTRLMSPRSTHRNCGSSSRLVLRRTRPRG